MKVWSDKHTIPVFWWHRGALNMGDEASGYIIRKLTPLKIKRIDNPVSSKAALRNIVSSVIRFKVPNFKPLIKSLFGNQRHLFGLGSIISFANRKSVIWGSGFQDPNLKFRGKTILAVRGLETIKILKQRNLRTPEIIGDPGLLMPLIYRPAVVAQYNIGIIPHIKERESVGKIAQKYGLKVISMETDDVEGTINDILKCRCILSSSLHGLIFAHAYGIPAIFFTYEHKGEGLFKYFDYFSSVAIPYYKPFELRDLLSKDSELLHSFIADNKYARPQANILKIQRDLLSVAPFRLSDKFSDENISDQLIEEDKYLRKIADHN